MINLVHLEKQNIENFKSQLEGFISKVEYGRFLKETKFEKSYFAKKEAETIIDYALKNYVFIAVNEQSQICGFIGFHFSQWDTDIFDKQFVIIKHFVTFEEELYESYNIANDLLEYFESWVISNNYVVAVVKIDSSYSSCIRAIREKNYEFYETIAIQSLDLKNTNKNTFGDIEYRFADEGDLHQLQKIALENTFPRSHFYLDHRFEVSAINKMYSNWIINAFNSDNKILIVEHSKEIAGMFIYNTIEHKDQKISTWIFAAIDKKYRNLGLGNKLFNATTLSCLNDGAIIIDTSLAVQNTISLRIHSKLNFHPVLSMYTFHKWFKDI